MIQQTLVRAACLAAVLLALTGCQNTVNTLSGGPGVTAADLKRFTSDSFCRDRLEVMAVNMAQTDGGMRQLQVTLRSERYGFFPEIWSWITGENPYYINYRVDWFDGNGMQVPSPSSNWMTEIFYPGETKYIRSVAPTSQCADYMVSLKEKND